jgi:perosamine synthetase
MTFFSTATAVLRVGATPIFADINHSTYNLSSYDVLNKITDNTKAIIPVHFYGLPADMDEFNKIGSDYGIYIIEDAAQAHGAEYKGKKVGSLGDAACWSFFATKNMTCACEAGMVTTNNENTASKISVLRSHGMCDRNTHAMLGYNDRMDEIAAAVGFVQLQKLDALNKRRVENSMYLRRNLRDVPWLRAPPLFRDRTHVFFWANFEVNEELLGMSVDDLRTSLWDRGIGTRHRYNTPLYKQPVLNQFLHLHRYDKDYCPNAEKKAGRMIGLPNYPGLTENELHRVVDIIKET